MGCQIVIPSHKRAGRVRTTSVVANAIICVPESQQADYARSNPNTEIVTHPDTVIGLARKRDWIIKHFRDVFMLDDDIGSMQRVYTEQAKKKEDKNEPQRLSLTHAVLLLCRARKSRMIDWALIWAWLTHPFRKLAVPDFALDKHNERGRRLKRSWAHFFSEGTQLEPHCAVDGEVAMRIQAMKAISDPSGNGLFPEN